MPTLVIVRLRPSNPTSGAKFTEALTGLTVTAFDLSVGDTATGTRVGSAGTVFTSLAPSHNKIDLTSDGVIAQHYLDVNDPQNPLIKIRRPQAAATAVIVASVPATYPEYPTSTSFDLRLQLDRDGPIADRRLDVNAVVTPVAALPTTVDDVIGMPVSAYATVPPASLGAGTHFELAEDGTPPAFTALVEAIDGVLALDPADGTKLARRPQLSPAQSLQIARELVWDRAIYPAPQEPRPLAQMYTSPPDDPKVKAEDAENDRRRFEAELDGYYATHEAQVMALAGFVFSASAAMLCERLSAGEDLPGAGPAGQQLDGAHEAVVPLPLPPGGSDGTTLTHTAVLLAGSPAGSALNPPFVVPAAYFYALGAQLPPQVDAGQRYAMARADTEAKLVAAIQAAQVAGLVGGSASPEAATSVPADPVNPAQAARRLRALGQALTGAPRVPLTGPVATLVTAWLTYAGPTGSIDAGFWQGQFAGGGYLDLLLHVVADDFDPLIAAVAGPPLSVTTAAGLLAVTDQQWRALFLPTTPPGAAPRLDLLPPFTQVGPASTPADRVEAFLRHLKTLFSVPFAAQPQSPGAKQGAPPVFPAAGGDVLRRFAIAYAGHGGGTYTVGGRDAAASAAAVLDVFPGDADAQAWLSQALDVLDALYQLTAFAADPDPRAKVRFSLMEALYARGFTTVASVQALSSGEFRAALEGSVAYPYAAAIQTAPTSAAPPQPGPLRPVNPGSTLVDCVPPEHLSPFGAVAYLHDLLQVTAASTCDAPYAPDAGEAVGALLAGRRGPLGDLHATAANLWTPVRAVDLVNESLEGLAAAVVGVASGDGGPVFDTASDTVAGHLLAAPGPAPGPAAVAAGGVTAPASGSCGSATGPVRYRHDPATLLSALPEHSSPAAVDVSPASAAAYRALATDATAPQLPYDQPLDVDRTYLEAMGGSRYEAMRRFRRDIREFVLDPAHEPAGFARHLWRYPVRLEIALEYLCIGAHEYATLFATPPGDEPADGVPAAWQLYGFAAPDAGDRPWTAVAVRLPEMLARTGLAYCELADLQRSGLVPFGAVSPGAREEGVPGPLPGCEPCCLDGWEVTFTDERDRRSPGGALFRLALAVRLWRLLRRRCAGGLSFTTLADLDSVLHLFPTHRAVPDGDETAAGGGIDPEFLRQLAAILILCEDFGLPLLADPRHLPEQPGPVDRVPLLGLWSGAGGTGWARAVRMLLDGVEDTAGRTEPELQASPELLKIISENLDPLSQLCGFAPGTPSGTWFARPTHTLRLAEVLLKIYRSRFTVGELLFLYTTGGHLAGDDPFPLQDEGETTDDPLALGDTEPQDGEGPHSLWALRRALHEVSVGERDASEWSWPRIVAALWRDFGYRPPANGPDPLEELGRHFFADELERTGVSVPAAARRYTVPLADTSPLMWAETPLRYDATARELSAELPLHDAALLDHLLHLRPLRSAERRAVRDLYFAPRAALAPFAAIFENPVGAIEHLVQHGDSGDRFAFFQRAFALFHRRCAVVAAHLARHVLAATGDAGHRGHDRGKAARGGYAEREEEVTRAAWRVLRALWADENFARTTWEDDSGAPPAVTWDPLPSGGAFAALLGVLGTGLAGEFSPLTGPEGPEDEYGAAGAARSLWWREARGPMSAFGAARDERNAPVPTVIPALDLKLTPQQARYVSVRNGLALLDATGAPLGGGQPFAVRWQGVLLIEHGGRYRFTGGQDGEHAEHAEHGERHDHGEWHDHGEQHEHREHGEDGKHGEGCVGRAWRFRLRRGQRTWTVLNHGMPGEEARGHRSGVLHLRRGAYDVVLEVQERRPRFGRPEDAHATRTGFRFGYEGPDTGGAHRTLPFDRLFLASKDATMAEGVVQPPGQGEDGGVAPPAGAIVEGERAAAWLGSLYTSSLRDIRRTYQRAFKGLLLTHRAGLSARPLHTHRHSELGYLLDHAETFAGTAHPRTGPDAFGTHRAWFDLNLLPVGDTYPPQAVLAQPVPPYSAVPDQRSDPSAHRRTALFDTWERLIDYADLRRQTRAARERPAWVLFSEVSEQQPDDPAQLLRHLGIDLRHAPLVSTYAVPAPEAGPCRFGPADLEDEQWATRAWRGATWLRRIERHLTPADVTVARPDLWAADDPAAADADGLTGLANLTGFVQAAYLENGEPRRYADLERLNDGLRERARESLVAYLCAQDRVPLPGAAGFARTVTDLSDLLLQDVGAGLCRSVTRIEDAISAIQAFIQRAVLGLEPTLPVGAPLLELWQCRLATFRDWQATTRRAEYRENWIEWGELLQAQRHEAFVLLEQRLREDVLSVPVPGGLTWWPGPRPPRHPSLELLQAAERSGEWLVRPPAEGLGLLGSPEPTAAPSWLSPMEGPATSPRAGGDGGNENNGSDGPDGRHGPEPTTPRTRRRPAAPAERRRGRATERVPESAAPETAVPAAAPLAAPADPIGAAVERATGGALVPATRTEPKLPEQVPLWLSAAIGLGARFVRVAAAGLPPASARLHAHHAAFGDGGACCDACGREQPVGVDEYYFWLAGSSLFDDADAVQDAEAGVVVSTLHDPHDQTPDWHRPARLPALLHWQPRELAHLWWCRVHAGEFQPPRRSCEGVVVASAASASLVFHGRQGDSLRFSVTGGAKPVGHEGDPGEPGFRYDLATDAAVVLPLVAVAASGPSYVGGLAAYPYFVFLPPGAPLVPLSRFAVAMTVAGALRAHCRYDAALAWYDLFFSPLEQDDSWALCEDTAPSGPDEGPVNRPIGGRAGVRAEGPIAGPADVRRGARLDVACCPSSPADDATARRRAVLLAYLETLLDAADGLLCNGSQENAQRARTMLDVAGRILGRAPRRVDAQDDSGQNGQTGHQPDTVAGFVPRPAPLNPRLLALYERREDRAELVRRCLDGHRLRQATRQPGAGFWTAPDRPSILTTMLGEPAALLAEQACDTCGPQDAGGCCAGPYRFTFLVQKALELAAEVRALGGSLLSAYEKGDAEALAALRAGHDRQVLDLGVRTRQLQWREADWQVQALQKTKQGALARLAYYQGLLRRGNNAGEIGYEALTGVSIASRAAANISEGIAQGIGMTPDFWLGGAGIAGSPLQFDQLPLGNKLAAGFSTAARIMNGLAEIASASGALSLTEGGWDRRTQEWQHQVQVISIELEQIERQILAAERRRDAALRDLNLQQQQAENAAAVQDFVRDKLTSAQLYLYLQRETAAAHRRLYDLALGAARRAQRAFSYERATSPAAFLPIDPWDGVERGLMAGERLHVALRQMEAAYLDENCREYELTKHLSLRVDFPLAFLQLQQTGNTEIEVPEWMFDLDYPGHYLRRIKNVTLTIPAVAGPYTGVHCRLTLLSSVTRVDPRLAEPAVGCCGECSADRRCACDPVGPCRCRGGGKVPNCPCATGACPRCRARGHRDGAAGYALTPDDPRAVRSYVAGDAIATSSGQNDSGLFEFGLRDERYLPFEFRGAVSRWRIELPPETNRFDLDTLGDVILHLNYTAREGGERLREAAAAAARRRLPGAGVRLFDARHDFPDEWHALTSAATSTAHRRFGAPGMGQGSTWPLRLSRDFFPYIPGGCDIEVTKLELFVELDDPGCRGSLPVTLITRHHREHEHEHGNECDCPGEEIVCVPGAEWPCLFHGAVEFMQRLPRQRPRHPVAVLRFPGETDQIAAIHLVCAYRTVGEGA